jgi:Domain of unknown function (DUF4918)
MSMDEDILHFYRSLVLPSRLTSPVQVLNPYADPVAFDISQKFYRKFYHDDLPRRLMLGINPGRFGSGTTGISFTDPIRLEADCDIANPFPKKPELSSDFIYRVIHAYGGPALFYSQYFISAVSPLGFTQGGKNINYYDVKPLQKKVTPFIIQSLDRICAMKLDRNVCICIGEGKNYEFLKSLNQTHQWFREIRALPHPRFIMQYKRKQLGAFIDDYLKVLRL